MIFGLKWVVYKLGEGWNVSCFFRKSCLECSFDLGFKNFGDFFLKKVLDFNIVLIIFKVVLAIFNKNINLT